ncbi:Rv2732c family membrane protein [Prescottella agglutinans]|uniref:Rv2732c family membrane protein n=1 Tax=Prescottella agglutinans TaxID=1644129 RepID=UPI003D985F93
MQRMSERGDAAGDENRPAGNGSDPMAEYEKDFEAAEKKIAGEIDPGVRAVVVAVCVLVLLLSFTLPHAGSANGWDVLVYAQSAVDEHIKLPSRIFVWLALVFGGVFSVLALVTRRWVLAWIAVAGTAVSAVFGMLAVWSRQTLPLAESGSAGPGIGLILGWITVIVLTFHWIKVVWSRTAMQLAAEEERRRAAADDADHGDWTV